MSCTTRMPHVARAEEATATGHCRRCREQGQQQQRRQHQQQQQQQPAKATATTRWRWRHGIEKSRSLSMVRSGLRRARDGVAYLAGHDTPFSTGATQVRRSQHDARRALCWGTNTVVFWIESKCGGTNENSTNAGERVLNKGRVRSHPT